MTSDNTHAICSGVGYIESERIIALFDVLDHLDDIDITDLPEPWTYVEDIKEAILMLANDTVVAVRKEDDIKILLFSGDPEPDCGFIASLCNCIVSDVGHGITTLRIYAQGIDLPSRSDMDCVVVFITHTVSELIPYIDSGWELEGLE